MAENSEDSMKARDVIVDVGGIASYVLKMKNKIGGKKTRSAVRTFKYLNMR